VSKKGGRGAKPGRGTTKGPYKLVDKRLKKDKMKGKAAKKTMKKPVNKKQTRRTNNKK
jgi:hypothetical protein